MSRYINYTLNFTSSGQLQTTNLSAGTLNVSGGLTTGSILSTGLTTGNINFTGSLFQNGLAYLGSQWTTTAGNVSYTSGSVVSTNFVATNTSTGILNASTGITSATLLVTGMITASSVQATSSTVPNVVHTNISSGTLNASTGITSATLLVTGMITAGSVQATSSTVPNVVFTNTSTGTINASTGITSATLLVTGMITAGSVQATSSTIPNVVTTNISTGTLRGTDLFLTGTLTTVNITTQNLLVTTNSITVGSLLVSGGNLNMTGGNLNISGGSINISGGALNVSGNISSASTVSALAFTGGSLQISGTTSTANLVATTATVSNIFSTNITSSTLNIGAGIQVLMVGTTGGSPVNTSALIRNTYGSLEIAIPAASANFSTSAIPGDTVFRQNDASKNMMFNIGAGAASMYIASSSNVGIGTAAPTVKLDIAGTTRIFNTTATSIGSLTVVGPGASTYNPATTTIGQLATFYGPSGGGIISNIDLSTFVPVAAASYNLPSVRFSMLDLGAANSTFNILTKNSGGTGTMASRIMIDGSGNVGINTTSPVRSLHVQGPMRIGSSTAVLDFGDDFLTQIYKSGTEMRLTTNATDRMRIDASGLVGINSTPVSRLTVNPEVVDKNTFDHSLAPVTITNPTPTGTSTLNDQLPVLHLARQGAGGQAFGARATFALSRYENNSVNSRTRLDIQLAQSTYNIVDVMSLRGDGNVGIGTTAPSDILQVSTVMLMASSGNLTVTGDVLAFGTISDQRLKENVTDISTGLDIINNLRPVTFNWKQDIFNKNRAGTRDSGFIAQEVEKILEHAVSEYTEIETCEKYKNMRHERIIPYLVKAIQELSSTVNELRGGLRPPTT
jgi:hypothetical protein